MPALGPVNPHLQLLRKVDALEVEEAVEGLHRVAPRLPRQQLQRQHASHACHVACILSKSGSSLRAVAPDPWPRTRRTALPSKAAQPSVGP